MATINNVIARAQYLEKLSDTEYQKYYFETDDKQVKLSEQIGSYQAGSSLVTLIKAVWGLANKAGVTSVKIGDGEPENGAVVVTLEKLGTVAITQTQVNLISTNQSNIATLTSNLVNNTYGFAKKSDIASVFRYKGTVASESNLPSSGQTVGDVYFVTDKGCEHAWNGSKWEELGPTIDLSNYVTAAQLNAKIEELHTTITAEIEATETTINGKITALTSRVSAIENGTKKVVASTADKLATARTIALSGDVTGSASFDGSANATISATLKNSGVTAGTYSAVQVNAKGIVTKGQQVLVFADSIDAAELNNLCIGGMAIVGA